MTRDSASHALTKTDNGSSILAPEMRDTLAARFLAETQLMLARLIPCDLIFHAELDFLSLTASVFGADTTSSAVGGFTLTPISTLTEQIFQEPPGTRVWVTGDTQTEGVGDACESAGTFPPSMTEVARSLLASVPPDTAQIPAALPQSNLGVFTTDAESYYSKRASLWCLFRSERFKPIEVQLVIRLQPILSLLESVCRQPGSHHLTDSQTQPWEIPEATRESECSCLTDREVQVVRLLCQGMTAVHIGHVLCISPLTVRKHLQNVYTKLDVHDRLLLVDVARRRGLLDPQPGGIEPNHRTRSIM